MMMMKMIILFFAAIVYAAERWGHNAFETSKCCDDHEGNVIMIMMLMIMEVLS